MLGEVWLLLLATNILLQWGCETDAGLSYRDNRNRRLELVAQTAESISSGDIVEKTIRSKNAWNLLPSQVSFMQ